MAATRCLVICIADLTRRASRSIRLVEVVDALHGSALAERTTTAKEIGKRRYGVSLGRLGLTFVGPAFVAAATSGSFLFPASGPGFWAPSYRLACGYPVNIPIIVPEASKISPAFYHPHRKQDGVVATRSWRETM
jgi:hypothetical protein